MPALDNSAASSALSLLNGIDYAAIIGAPLQAAIKAQAMAARSTWEFIQEVGLKTDENGDKSAVNVEFVYQKDGEMVRLLVPILTIVPIPCIVVTEVDIQFKASINASASQASEQSESSELAGELGVSARAGWGPFSISANFKANYSSKKDSKATQESRYSVEYTQDVRVRAQQADVPPGLATVLGILSSAATGASLEGDLEVSPAIGMVSMRNPLQKQSLQIRARNGNGLNVKDVPITLRLSPAKFKDAVIVGYAPTGIQQLNWKDDGTVVANTGKDGRLSLLVWLNDDRSTWDALDRDVFELTVSGTIDDSTHEHTIPFRIQDFVRAKAEIDASTTVVEVPADTSAESEPIVITARDRNGNPVASQEVNVETRGTRTSLEANDQRLPQKFTTDANGQISLRLKWASGPSDTEQGTLVFSTTIDGEPVTKTIGVKVKTTQLLRAVHVSGPSLGIALGAAIPSRELVRAEPVAAHEVAATTDTGVGAEDAATSEPPRSGGGSKSGRSPKSGS